MRVLIDTNILLRERQRDSPQHLTARDAIATVTKTAKDVVVVPQVMAEFWNVATRPRENNGLGMETLAAEKSLDAIANLFPICLDQPDIYYHWRQLIKTYDVKGVRVHDARLVAAMIAHGLTHILTFNIRDFKRYQEVMVIDPDTL